MSHGADYDAVYAENARLRSRIAELEKALQFSQNQTVVSAQESTSTVCKVESKTENHPYTPEHCLTPDEMVRYSRHLILPEIGIEAQTQWSRHSRVLVIGAGGLGAPIILYLATAGVRKLTIVDDDVVDVSNLQRQVIHTEQRVGQSKAESARAAALERNSLIDVVAFSGRFTAENALELAQNHDVLVDATDNVATRYLINDAGVLAGKPVVSGSALRMEGQLTVYNYQGGPCYRCLFPTPPPAETVTNCSDGGVLGVVPGIIGVTQALETLKVLANQPRTNVLAQRLLVFDATTSRFRTLNLRPRNPTCAVCGDQPSIVSLNTATHDVTLMCPALQSDRVEDQIKSSDESKSLEDTTTAPSNNTSKVKSVRHLRMRDFASQYYEHRAEHGCWNLKKNVPMVLLDVREPVQHKICSLPGDINVPRRLLGLAANKLSLDRIKEHPDEIKKILEETPLKCIFDALHQAVTVNANVDEDTRLSSPDHHYIPVIVYCRRGLDSVLACKHLEVIADIAKQVGIKVLPQPLNLTGGLGAFMTQVDSNFPLY